MADKAYYAIYREEHRYEIKKRTAKWRKEHKEHIRKYHSEWLKKRKKELLAQLKKENAKETPKVYDRNLWEDDD